MKKRVLATILCCLFPIIACSCEFKQGLPDLATAQDKYNQNAESMKIVTDYLLSLPYECASIDEPNGTFFSDFEWRSIDDEDVCAAIKLLWESEISSIIKSEEMNAVSFDIWSSFQEVSCGVAFSIDGTGTPSVEFMTQIEPLSAPGWYYYVADYNEWRIQASPSKAVP